MVEASDWFVNENKQTGGSYGALIGVSDIGRAIAFYSDILGYDRVTYDTTGVFPDLSNVAGGRSVFRRVLLERSGHVKGPFSKVFGKSVIELIQSVNRPGRKIFEGRFWGDLGFIHLCFDIHGMDRLREYCNSIGYPFTVDSKKSHDGKSFDMGEAAGHFAYIEDPDGTLIELVETHRVPILKKLGLYLDLTRRDPRESLPDWIVKLLRFSKVKLK
jgi:catechol 2,3-dioxygenase-like lactoylglutathione lyase family enzyme